MDDISTGSLGVALLALLITSGFFSLAETAMMAVNRFRLKHRAERGARGARSALALLAETDRLLGVVLLGNNLINAASATLTTVITVRLFGEGEIALALGTVIVTFGILVISEITPKVIGAAHADRLAPALSFALRPMLRIATPIVWFVNLFVQGLLRLLFIRPAGDSGPTLTQEELRSLVLEGQYFRGKHRAMLANLLDLESITVDDVMTPRNQIHAIDITTEQTRLVNQLATSYHTRMPVYEDELDNIIGTLHLKQVLHLQYTGGIDRKAITSVLRPAYFVPSGTPLLTQLQQFQNDRERLGLVVDEYGELQGLLTLEDIIEEIIGDFTTGAPGPESSLGREPDASVVADGMALLRTLNRKLGTRFPVDGPKTLNGLIVEQLGEIPDAGTVVEVAGQTLEILHTQDRAIKVVRLRAPVGRDVNAPLQSRSGQASSARQV